MKVKWHLRKTGFVLGVAFAALAPGLAAGQSFNIDLDVFFGSAALGNGAPSSSFGAAANQPGYWNRINGSGTIDPAPLFGLSQQATAATLQVTGGYGTRSGFNQPLNTGDYALLLNDVANPEPQATYTFRSLSNGLYRVITYAANPNLRVEQNQVTVLGASTPNPQVVTGPMPGNAFILGITHSDHTVTVSDNTLVIDIRSLQFPTAAVNGFQLTLVPEPSGLAILFFSLFGLSRARRLQGKRSP